MMEGAMKEITAHSMDEAGPEVRGCSSIRLALF